MKKIFLFLSVALTYQFGNAQTKFVRDLNIPLTQYGLPAPLAYSGGINGGMFSEIDLNNDGIKDLFLFDKDQVYKKARISTFLNTGTPNTVSYQYAPEYIANFPTNLADWAILVDYNHDGKEDIFTYSNQIPAAGITVYKNISTPTQLQFALEYSLLYANIPSGQGNIYVSSNDKPAIVDFDGDGDLDIIAIYIGGGRLEWSKNIGMETLGKNDTLIFDWQPSCWGHFGFSANNNSAILNVACKPIAFVNNGDLPATLLTPEPTPDPTRHNGACFVIEDFNKDGLVDYLGGDAIGNNILYLQNGGTLSDPLMISQDSLFPVYDNSAFFFEFLNPTHIDVNNDGKKDLLVSPCKNGDAENFHNVWYYKNVGTVADSFSYQYDNFLVNQMVDVGEGAKVCFFDADADGLMDIMVGNQGYYDGYQNIGGINYPLFESGIAWYKNTGTASAPAFTLQTIDWMNLFQYTINAMHPTFGDLDGDSDMDMIVGEETGKLFYFINSAGPGVPADFSNPPIPNFMAIDVGKMASPQLIDLNKDNLLDLVVGNELGKLRYFENTGTITTPLYTNNLLDFGAVDVTQGLSATGMAVPYMYRTASGSLKLLVSNEQGYIFLYDNIDNNLGGVFNLIDTFFQSINEPVKATINGYDINADNLMDLVVGNQAGGFVIYKQVSTSGINNDETIQLFDIYPVPANQIINIRLNQQISFGNYKAEIFDVNGRLLNIKFFNEYYVSFNVQHYSDGIYTCKITNLNDGKFNTKKFIKAN
ncbi:MAG: T9SS type A sorting domain-containing protein [Bacteroidia bacterium]|nr:T9SS type A sorting domain-containing protein [Bacteroidia bacterium]